METTTDKTESVNRLESENILYFPAKHNEPDGGELFAQEIASAFEKKIATTAISEVWGFSDEQFSEYCDAQKGVFLVFDIPEDGEVKYMKKVLALCRTVRIPYLLIKGNIKSAKEYLQTMLVPVTFLPEEKEKGPWTKSFARFIHSAIYILKPNDKGSRASKNVAFIEKLVRPFAKHLTITQGKQASYRNRSEILDVADGLKNCIIMLSASREYGLDDLIFGSFEQNLIKRTDLPVMLINPRDDLYVLCGD